MDKVDLQCLKEKRATLALFIRTEQSQSRILGIERARNSEVMCNPLCWHTIYTILSMFWTGLPPMSKLTLNNNTITEEQLLLNLKLSLSKTLSCIKKFCTVIRHKLTNQYTFTENNNE